ncbi:MAG: hypothetical protein JWQ39_647 [Glaciihabitans sp.]|jgi:hypothetical protein|nr:hypothetical protein [Glaciihabitans sp.]
MVFERNSVRSAGLTPDARDDIRRAEAARMLELLVTDHLPERATRWIAEGADTANARALAQSTEASSGVRLALVAEIAAELGLGIASDQEARQVQAETIIRSISSGQNFSRDLFALSNSYTDAATGRVSQFLGRLLRGR